MKEDYLSKGPVFDGKDLFITSLSEKLTLKFIESQQFSHHHENES
jgi:hypothetical protein